MYANLSGWRKPALHDTAEVRDPAGGRQPLPVVRLGAIGRDGRLVLADAPAAASLPAEGFEPAFALKALCGRAELRRAADSAGRSVVLVYAPGRDREPAAEVLLLSMLHLGDELRRSARRLGLSGLASRICAALVESGSLREAAAASGLSYLTARSEIRDAMEHAGVACQAALVRRLAQDWIGERLDGERVGALLASVFGLSLRDARTASLRAAGLSRPQAAARMGISRWAMEESCARVHTLLGVHNGPQLTRVIVDLLLAADLADARRRQGESA